MASLFAVALVTSTQATGVSAQGTSIARGESHQRSDNGAPQNIVQLVNSTDNKLRVAGHVQLNTTDSTVVNPVNEAVAYGSCNNCQTLAVALQINLLEAPVTQFQPQNVAFAVNYHCFQCTTVADAVQYNISVSPGSPDAEVTANRAKHLVKKMNEQFADAASAANVAQAEAEINGVLQQFQDLASTLTVTRDEDDRNTAEPPGTTPAAAPPAPPAANTGPTAAPSSTPPPQAASPSPAPGPTPSPAATPTAQPSPSKAAPTPAASPSPAPHGP